MTTNLHFLFLNQCEWCGIIQQIIRPGRPNFRETNAWTDVLFPFYILHVWTRNRLVATNSHEVCSVNYRTQIRK